MTHIVFYEKPGCGGNARQRAALEAAGHTLQRRNLLTAPWTRESLLEFLAPLPVPDWFNRAAPRVKSAEVQPHTLTHEEALQLLLADPLLIRRPLMQRADTLSRCVGFDTSAVNAWVGLGTNPASAPSLEGCASPAERCNAPLAVTGDRHADV
jgi:nitrogenase-associated protein